VARTPTSGPPSRLQPAAPATAEVKHVVILGAGGFGREVLQYVRDTYGSDPGYAVKGFLDDAPKDLEPFGLGVPVLGDIESYRAEPADRLLIAIGDPKVRQRLAERFAAQGATFLTVVHPLAYVSPAARVGEGCIIAPFASVGAHATVGDHTVVTFYGSIGHDSVVGRYCIFAPHAVTNGMTTIGDGAYMGAHAVVVPLKSVGAWARVAAGAVVYRPVPDGTFAVGNPAKPRQMWTW
jgi:sugar O-acyltransferase (sialic acid O-acetyltransferase NeuD family)